MIYYEVIENHGDGSYGVTRFKTMEQAKKYVEENEDWCTDGWDKVDTESKYFFYDESGE